MAVFHFLWSLTTLIIFPLSILARTCYTPNGSIAPDDIECYPSRSNSFCCGSGWACLDNQLCAKTSISPPPVTGGIDPDFVRGTCTDESWSSAECPRFCIGQNNTLSGGNWVNNCGDDYTYCCWGLGGSSPCSCDSGDTEDVLSFTANNSPAVTVGSGTSPTSPASFTSSSTSATLTSSSSTIPTTPSSSSPPPSTAASSSPTSSRVAEHHDSDTSLAVGIGVGVPLFLIALGSIAFLLRRNRRLARKMRESQQQHVPVSTHYETPPTYAMEQGGHGVPRHVHTAPAELIGSGTFLEDLNKNQ